MRVLFLTRNPLDVLISTEKHRENATLTDHCPPADAACIASQRT